MTSIESLHELVAMADEIRELWIETEYERGHDIPEPTYPVGATDRFVPARELSHTAGRHPEAARHSA